MKTFSFIVVILFCCCNLAWSARITITHNTTNKKDQNLIEIVCKPNSLDMEEKTVTKIAIYREHIYNIGKEMESDVLSENFNPSNSGENSMVIHKIYNPKVSDVGAYKCLVRSSRNGKMYTSTDIGLLKSDGLKGIERIYSFYENCQKGYLKPEGDTTPCVEAMIFRNRFCIRYTETYFNLKLTGPEFQKPFMVKKDVMFKNDLNKEYIRSVKCAMNGRGRLG